MSVLLPTSLPEALAYLSDEPDAIPMAGGTDLLVHWPGRVADHERTYLDLSHVAELRPTRWTDRRLVLGALTTYWDVVRDPKIAAEFPLLVQAARQVGAIQIQARGTWAGNIVNASPAADGVPVLMAYDAVVALQAAKRTDAVPLDRFYRGYKQMRRQPDELVVSVGLPRRPHDVQFFEKVGARRAQAIAKVGVAVTHSAAGWRVVAASVAPTVIRCRSVERWLDSGKPVRQVEDLIPEIARDIAPIDDIRSTAAYRRRVLAQVLFQRLKESGR